MIDTNCLNIDLNHSTIDRDFAIFKVQMEDGDFQKDLIPDVALQEGKALSVQYTRNKECYILYDRKAADLYGLRHRLEDYNDGIIISQVSSQEPKKYILAQLLFNAIPSLGSGNRMYHNLTGKLYYLRPDWKRKGSLYTIQMKLNYDFCMMEKVHTFKQVSNKKRTGQQVYLFDTNSGMFRRSLKDDPDCKENLYEIGTWDTDKHNNVSFLGFSSMEEFEKSKVGILARFMQDVKELLGEYLTAEYQPMEEGDHFAESSDQHSIEKLFKQLRECGVYIEDTIVSAESEKLRNGLKLSLKHNYQIEVKDGIPGAGEGLLRIVHEPDYYSDTKKDPYRNAPPDCVVQHLTLEHCLMERKGQSWNEQEDPYLYKILLEVGIKRDIMQKQLLFYDWASLKFLNPINFVTANLLDQKSRRICFDRLTITPNGKLSFDTWEDKSIYDDPLKIAIKECFLNKWDKFDHNVEGLVYDRPDAIQIIRSTERITLPDTKEMLGRLDGTAPEEQLDLNILRSIIEEQAENNVRDRERKRMILERLKPLGSTAARKEIRKILPNRGNLNKAVYQEFRRRTGRCIGCSMRDKESKEGMLAGIIDIRYLVKDGRHYYYAGYFGAGMKSSIQKACRIREVTAPSGNPDMDMILPLLAVEFVRISAWTVLPFPFKYLREWREEQDMKF